LPSPATPTRMPTTTQRPTRRNAAMLASQLPPGSRPELRSPRWVHRMNLDHRAPAMGLAAPTARTAPTTGGPPAGARRPARCLRGSGARYGQGPGHRVPARRHPRTGPGWGRQPGTPPAPTPDSTGSSPVDRRLGRCRDRRGKQHPHVNPFRHVNPLPHVNPLHNGKRTPHRRPSAPNASIPDVPRSSPVSCPTFRGRRPVPSASRAVNGLPWSRRRAPRHPPPAPRQAAHRVPCARACRSGAWTRGAC
jgi:hypothetical protein